MGKGNGFIVFQRYVIGSKAKTAQEWVRFERSFSLTVIIFTYAFIEHY
jgi:hypothetical protein